MSFVSKVTTASGGDCVNLLMRAFYQVVGDKGFMRNLENILETRLADLSAQEKDTICMLARALQSSKSEETDRKPWMRGF